MREIRAEMKENFDKMKKEYDDIYHMLEDDIKSNENMDIEKS